MRKRNMLAGNGNGNHIFRCAAGQIHFNYGNVELRFCQESFLMFSEVVNQAICRISQGSQSDHVHLTCGYVSLKIPRQESGNLVDLVNEAVYKIKGVSYISHHQKN